MKTERRTVFACDSTTPHLPQYRSHQSWALALSQETSVWVCTTETSLSWRKHQNFTDKDTWHKTHGKIRSSYKPGELKIFEEPLQKAGTLLGAVIAALGSAWGGTKELASIVPFPCPSPCRPLFPSPKLNYVSSPPKPLLLRQGDSHCHHLDLVQAEVHCAKVVCK